MMQLWITCAICLASFAIVLCLCGTVIFLSQKLADANRHTTRFAHQALEHALAINVEERGYIKDRFDMEVGRFVVAQSRPPVDTTPRPRREPVLNGVDQDTVIRTDEPYEG